jgi:integrase
MASLQAKHSQDCALGRAWTPFDEAVCGCSCPDGPFYYVVVREGDASHKEPVGRDRPQAEIALHRLLAAIRDGDYRPRPTIGFIEWADRWLASLERKPSTVGSYRSTIVHAKEAFGRQHVRRIGAEDIARFSLMLRERGCSPSTRAKHLRVLGACMQAAVFYRYSDSNPVRELPPAQRPRPERKEAAYFENQELPRLFARLRSEPYRALCLVALKTGMRQGELLGLRWGDVDLEQAVIRVRLSYTGGVVGTPKNRERRDVDLISDVVDLLTNWRDNHTYSVEDLVFPGENGNRFLSPTVVLRRYLYPAMAAAEIGGQARRWRSERSTACDTHLPSGRLRVALRSRGYPATSATPPSR